ncbi:hypothetical protein [Mogibacterium diversum]|uniref:hypothetical protein n=1 Tax=Mogibacterium diversum TaxID=114527 RepID=UPI0026F149A9|nr:hypothetical protein [Mogibacterium diversum]
MKLLSYLLIVVLCIKGGVSIFVITTRAIVSTSVTRSWRLVSASTFERDIIDTI